MEEGFRTFDHTGDLGLEVWAESAERLHELAVLAMMAQVAQETGTHKPAEGAAAAAAGAAAPGGGPGTPEAPEVTMRLELEGDEPADLLVHWLNTALLHSSLEHALWTRAVVERLTQRSIVARLEGPRLDPRRQVFLREIKAVSHHDLALALEPPRCRCRLILDL